MLLCIGSVTAQEPEAAKRQLRFHEIGSLIRARSPGHAPSLSLTRGHYGDDSVVARGGVLSFDDEDDWGNPWVSPVALAFYCEQTIGRLTGGGAASLGILGEQLLVRDTPAVHEQLEAVLEHLRALERRAVRVELKLLALKPDQTWFLEGGAGAPLAPATLARLAKLEEDPTLASLDLVVQDGRQAARASVERTSFVGDYEVNQTGTAPVLNPVVTEVLAGCAAGVRVEFPTGDEPFLLDCELELARPDAERRTIEFPAAGVIELPSGDHLYLGTTVRARPGQTTLLGAIHAPEAGQLGGLIAVTCRFETVGEAVPPAPAEPSLRRYDLTRLLALREYGRQEPRAAPADMGSRQPGGFSFEDQHDRRELDAHEIKDWVMDSVESGSWARPEGEVWLDAGGTRLIVVQSATAQQAIADFLRGLGPQGALGYELLVVDSPRTAGGAVLDAAAREELLAAGTVRERILVSGLEGQQVQLGAHAVACYLQDVERCAGGCAPETDVQVDDPIVGAYVRGSRLRVSGRPVGEVLELQVDIDRRAGTRVIESETAWGTIEGLADQHHTVLRQTLSLAPGETRVLATEREGAVHRLYLLRASRID